MAKSKATKEQELGSLKDKLGTMTAAVFSRAPGLTVKDATDLRKSLRGERVDLMVVKKTLLRRALKDQGLDEGLVEQLEGSISVAFGYADEVAPAKLLQKFAKDHPQLEMIGGLVGAQFLSAAEVKALAKLPSKQEMLAKTVGTIQAPITGFVNVLAGNLRSLINVLQALKDKQPA